MVHTNPNTIDTSQLRNLKSLNEKGSPELGIFLNMRMFPGKNIFSPYFRVLISSISYFLINFVK